MEVLVLLLPILVICGMMVAGAAVLKTREDNALVPEIRIDPKTHGVFANDKPLTL